LRGCGIAGLRGMPAQRGVFVRPLLNVWRAEVRSFLAIRSIVALEDPSNADTSYARVLMRTQLLPALERDRPGIVRRLHGVATRAAHLQIDIDAAAQELVDGSRSAIARADSAVSAETLRLLYVKAGGAQPSLSRAHIGAMRRLLSPGRGGRGVDLPDGLRFRVTGDRVEFVRSSTPRLQAHLHIRVCEGCESHGAIHLKAGLELKLGYRRPGLRLRPLGGRGTRKLQDVFVDARVPREDRDRWPLVFAGEQLAWVPGLAVDANLAAQPGESALHVSVSIGSAGEAENRVLKSIEPTGDLN
jgi:tRNA(Ile)-lysidine synthetase-like protein